MSKEVLKESFSNGADRVPLPMHPNAARDAWTDTDLSRIAFQARQAYEQKRLKNCMSFTKVLLEADPENAEAQALESAVREAIRTDLDHARALMHDVQFADSPQVFGKGAEIIVRRVLNIDPEEAEAKALLSELQNMTVRPVPPQPVSTSDELLANQWAEPENTSAPFTVISSDSSDPKPPRKKFMQTRLAWISLGALIGLAVLALFRGRATGPQAQYGARQADAVVNTTSVPAPVPSPPPASTAKLAEIGVVKLEPESKTLGALSPVPDKSLSDTLRRLSNILPEKPKPVAEPTVPPVNTAPLKAPATPPADRPVPKQTAAAVAETTGTLAVNSRVPTDIYMGDKFLGSTPTTLELTSGTHTLEYRYEGLRKLVTEVIKPGETKASTISFDVTVEINAKPWAQVSVVGVENRPLGQTPLSNVTVPVGSTLVFENPGFPKKNYRVTGKDMAIRMVFP